MLEFVNDFPDRAGVKPECSVRLEISGLATWWAGRCAIPAGRETGEHQGADERM